MMKIDICCGQCFPVVTDVMKIQTLIQEISTNFVKNKVENTSEISALY